MGKGTYVRAGHALQVTLQASSKDTIGADLACLEERLRDSHLGLCGCLCFVCYSKHLITVCSGGPVHRLASGWMITMQIHADRAWHACSCCCLRPQPGARSDGPR
jgi:hypothetical protein